MLRILSIPNIPSAAVRAMREGFYWLFEPNGSRENGRKKLPARGFPRVSASPTCDPTSKRRAASRRAGVPVMQSAHLRNGDHLSLGGMLDSARNRCVPFQRQMSAGFVVVCEVVGEDPHQVSLVEDDRVV